ncbi:MAG: hypothetical protein KA536_06415 [Saprospiraceae bacterium]|nr:hypothetical protein [Saprospiraceae bacterium]
MNRTFLILLILFLINSIVYSNNVSLIHQKDTVLLDDLKRDFQVKFKKFLQDNLNSPKNEFNSIFTYHYGQSEEGINTIEWVRNINAAVSPETATYFKQKLDRFNVNNGASMQHLVVLCHYPEFYIKTTKTQEFKDAQNVKTFIKNVEPGADTQVYLIFLQEIEVAASKVLNDPAFAQTNRMVTYWARFNKGDKKNGRQYWASKYYRDGADLISSFPSFWFYAFNTFVPSVNHELYRVVEGSIKYYENNIPANIDCNYLQTLLTTTEAKNFACQHFNLAKAKELLMVCRFIDDLMLKNYNFNFSQVNGQLSTLIDNFQSGADWESHVKSVIENSGYSDLPAYLGFTLSQLDFSFYEKLNQNALINLLATYLDKYAEIAVADYLFNDATRVKVNKLLQYYYNKFENNQAACLALTTKLRENNMRTKAIWELSDNLWSTTTTNGQIIHWINKISATAAGVVSGNITSKMQANPNKVVMWTIGKGHASYDEHMPEHIRNEYSKEIINNYSQVNINLEHCVQYTTVYPPNAGGFPIYTCNEYIPIVKNGLDPYDVLYVLDPHQVSIVNLCASNPAACKEGVAPISALGLAFLIDKGQDKEVKENTLLALQAAGMFCGASEGYALLSAGTKLTRILGGLILANELVINNINVPAVQAQLTQMGIGASAVQDVVQVLNALKAGGTGIDLLSMNVSKIESIVASMSSLNKLNIVQNSTNLDLYRFEEDLRRIGRRQIDGFDDGIRATLAQQYGFTKLTKYFTDEVELLILKTRLNDPQSNIIDKLNGMTDDEIFKLGQFLKHKPAGSPHLWDEIASSAPPNASPTEILDAYKDLFNKFGVGTNFTKHRSYEILNAAARHKQILPAGDISYDDFLEVIKNYKGACKGCETPPGGIPGNQTWIDPVEYLDAFVNLRHYSGVTGIATLRNYIKGTNNGFQDGGHHVAKYLKDNNIDPNDIENFEGNFADIIEDAFCSGCQYDMWLTDGTKVEFKSWKLNPTLQFTITKAINGQSTSFYPQFLTYLQTGKPQYNFNYHASKGQSIEAVKGEFKRLFGSSKAQEIFETNPSFFNRPNDPEWNPNFINWQAFQTYMQNAQNTSHKIFNFIK